MSWASRRRTMYLLGVAVFFIVVVGIPAAILLYKPPTCHDGKMNNGETDIDKGGPCLIMDERTLIPYSIEWARSFEARDGSWNAVAYIENPNKGAGVQRVSYHFGLYDSNNVLVAERNGSTYLMPGAVTPVFEGAILTGRRSVAHTYFEFTGPLVWQHMQSSIDVLRISNKQLSDTATVPRLSAKVDNSSVTPVINPEFVAVLFDPAGNATTTSATTLTRIDAGSSAQIVFTWPTKITSVIGRVDILPLLPPITPR